MTFLEAIAHEEGFYVADSRPQRNNNPGDVEFHSWMTAFGGVLETVPAGEMPRFAAFPNVDAGFSAMRHLFGFPAYKGKPVDEALNVWAPPVENQTSRYVAAVCELVGCEPTDCIDALVAL